MRTLPRTNHAVRATTLALLAFWLLPPACDCETIEFAATLTVIEGPDGAVRDGELFESLAQFDLFDQDADGEGALKDYHGAVGFLALVDGHRQPHTCGCGCPPSTPFANTYTVLQDPPQPIDDARGVEATVGDWTLVLSWQDAAGNAWSAHYELAPFQHWGDSGRAVSDALPEHNWM